MPARLTTDPLSNSRHNLNLNLLPPVVTLSRPIQCRFLGLVPSPFLLLPSCPCPSLAFSFPFPFTTFPSDREARFARGCPHHWFEDEERLRCFSEEETTNPFQERRKKTAKQNTLLIRALWIGGPSIQQRRTSTTTTAFDRPTMT